MRILLIRDERSSSDVIARGLREGGHDVDFAAYRESEESPDAGSADVILLDAIYPVKESFAVCRTLRKHGVQTPILMLGASDAVDNRVLGLESGADDYLAKPFAFAELLARLRALSRRQPRIRRDHTSQA